MDREQARAEYRKILAGVVRHHQAIDRHVTGAAMARIAKRFDLRVKGGISRMRRVPASHLCASGVTG
jgi:hypothetical protein